jgi:hypothetical protein
VAVFICAPPTSTGFQVWVFIFWDAEPEKNPESAHHAKSCRLRVIGLKAKRLPANKPLTINTKHSSAF